MQNNHQHLIAISGKLSSGKDTVADIIRTLIWEKNKRLKKSFDVDKEPHSDARVVELLTDDYIQSFVQNHTYQTEFVVKRFAHKVKEIASLLTGIPIEKFEDQEFKKSFLGSEWNRDELHDTLHISRLYDHRGKAEADGWNQRKGTDIWERLGHPMTVRELLQKIGTDCMRARLHSDVWVNSLFADWKLETSVNNSEPTPGTDEHIRHMMGLDIVTQWPAQKWLITDMRFPNELAAVKKHKGLTIRIVRPGHDSGSTHESETALDGTEKLFDEVLVNDGTLEELVAKVRTLLTKYKLL